METVDYKRLYEIQDEVLNIIFEEPTEFYRTYLIVNALRAQLNWFQYKQLISIFDREKRGYYELETVKKNYLNLETQ